MATEKQLDQALEHALKNDEAFANWFLGRTKLGSDFPNYVWSRSDYALPNRETGALEAVQREGETDVLAVFEGPGSRRLGLHIENKMAKGPFTPYTYLDGTYVSIDADLNSAPPNGMYPEGQTFWYTPPEIGLMLPNDASGNLAGTAGQLGDYLLFAGQTVTVQATLTSSLDLAHANGSFTSFGYFGLSGPFQAVSLVDFQATYTSSGTNTFQSVAYTYTNLTDETQYIGFWAAASSSLSGTAIPPAVTPVPEPSTYALMLAGLAGIVVSRRRANA